MKKKSRKKPYYRQKTIARKRGPKVGRFGPKRWAGFSIAEGLHERLRLMAKQEGISMSCWMERAILRSFTTFVFKNKKFASLVVSMPESLSEAAFQEAHDDLFGEETEDEETGQTDESAPPQNEEGQDE